jgi:hypothetical protein
MKDFPDAEEHARVILEAVKGDYKLALAFSPFDRTVSAVSNPVLIGRAVHVKSIRGRTDERMRNFVYQQFDAAVDPYFAPSFSRCGL